MAGSGLIALLAMTIARSLDLPGLTVSFSPLTFPSIPLLPVVGILIALAPAIAAPNPLPSSPLSVHGGPEKGEATRAATSGQGRAIQSDLTGVST